MSQYTLRRFDRTIYKAKSASDSSRIPAPSARVDFYLQGATVSSAATIGTSGNTTVSVYDSGQIAINDVLQVGVAGALVTVTAAPTSTSVTVSNSSGVSVSAPIGVRLILTSRRPTVYSDPFGTVAVPDKSFVFADVDGHATAYVEERLFDYVIGAPATLDTTSTATLDASQSTLSWTHQINESNTITIVSIAWQDSAGTEHVNSVTIGGVAMSPLASTAWEDVFYLQNAPVGSKTVLVTWSGAGAKGAAAAAISIKGSRPDSPLGASATASGTSTTASAAVTTTQSGASLVLSSVGVSPGTSTVSLTPTSPLQQKWNLSGGHGSAADLTQGGGATRTGSGGSVTTAWTLGSSKPWGIVVLEVPATVEVSTLEVDASGGAVPSPGWVDVRNFATIQAALDSLPTTGGAVYIPPGTYNASSLPAFNGIQISKSGTRLMGAGVGLTFLQLQSGGSVTQNTHAIDISTSEVTVEDLTVSGLATAGAGCGVRCYNANSDITNLVLSRLKVANTSSWGISITAASGKATDTHWIVDCVIYGAASGGSLLFGAAGASCNALTCRGTTLNGPGFGTYGPDSLSSGAVHLENALSAIFESCVIETPDGSTAISQNGGGNNCLRDCYFEFDTPGAGDKKLWAITTAGFASDLVVDNLHGRRHCVDCGPRLLQTGATSSQALGFQFSNIYFISLGNQASYTDDIVLGNSKDDLILQNAVISMSVRTASLGLAPLMNNTSTWAARRSRVGAGGAEVNLGGQTTSVATTTLVAADSYLSGLYLVSVYTVLMQSGSATSVTSTIGWTDDQGTARSWQLVQSLGSMPWASGSVVVRQAPNTALTYAATLGGGAATFGLFIRVEEL
jgi:hypothetical protein